MLVDNISERIPPFLINQLIEHKNGNAIPINLLLIYGNSRLERGARECWADNHTCWVL